MKKFMLLATAVGMTLTSCVNEVETPVESGRQVIAFDAPVMKNTRAVVKGEITDNTYPALEKFKVFCKITNGKYAGWGSAANYFKAGGDVAKHDGSYWATEDVYYWPDAGYSLAFSALSPAEFGTAAAGATVTRTENGIQVTNFVTEPASDDQYDLMYSRTVYDKTRENSAGAAVPLLFEHALTSIVFSSQKADESVGYKITDLQVTGTFFTKGNFSQGITENPAPSYSETETPVWTDLGEKVAVNYDPDFAAPAVVTTTPTIFTSGESAILPIPQSVPDDAAVTVSYSKTASGTVTTHTAKILLSEFRQAGDVKITEWERGKRYVYRIAFGQNDKIYFDPSVNNWDTQPTLIYTIK